MDLTVGLQAVKEKILAVIQNQTVNPLARSLVTVVTELSGLPQSN
jgi:hypothetical protein